MAKKNPSVDVATRASQALQAGVAPAMLHRHIGVHPTYADRREATVQPSGRHVTVHEFGLPRGAHSALAVVTGQRAGEYEVFLVRDGERELPVSGGKVALSGSGVARRNPRMKYIDDIAESMVNQEVAAIKAQGPASAACLSEHGAWGHVFDVLTYLYGHDMESIARRFTEGVISGDLGAVHLDDRILNKPAVGRNMQNKVSGAQAARAFRALRELCASRRTCAACKGSGQLRGETCSWCGGTGGGTRSNSGRTSAKGAPSGTTLDYIQQVASAAGVSYGRLTANKDTFRELKRAHRSGASVSEGVAIVSQYLPRANGGMAPFGGPGAPSMFNNMSDVLQGNAGRRNSGSPFAVNDRVTMRAGHHTGMGSPDGTVTHPGSSRSLVRFDDGTLVDVENRALVPLRRNLGDGPPPPPPVGNPHGWATLTLDNAYDNAPLRSKEHPEWGEKRLRYEGSEGRGYWTHWSNHGSAVLPEGEFRFWEIKGGSEGSRGKGYAHRYPRARANPLRRNHHLHPGDRVSMGAFIGTVDQQLPGTYDTYQVHWDRGGMDRVEGHKLRKVARNPGFGDYFRAGKKTAAEIGGHVAQAPSELVGEAQKGLAKLHTGLKEMGARAKAAAEREAASRKCDAPTPAEAIRVLAKAHGVKVNPNLGPHGYRRNLGDGPPPPPPLPFRENRGRWRRNLGDGPPPPPPVGNPSYLFTMPAGGVSTRPTRRNMGEGSFPAPFTRLPRGHYRSNPASQREPTDPFIDVTVAEGRVRAYDPRDKNKWFNFYVTNSSGAEARYALHSGHGRNATPYWGSNDTPPSWVLRVLKQNNFDWREA